ncbi:hypothetical protein IQ266_19620 [filamentous cyanobacterium LEGE 11480]|uniref:Uncharacterized protein n=1 Tax=Romeriopsis navalis LEGE 11480 TaxID=2777977 RepID=A0A928VTH7_9CYAN|nr:hypothetical protein [Romeriopsis navalis LEGE 11480]
MTRNIHDSFAKEWMKELLSDFGEVEIETQITGEVRTIDIVFQPPTKSSNPSVSSDASPLTTA